MKNICEKVSTEIDVELVNAKITTHQARSTSSVGTATFMGYTASM